MIDLPDFYGFPARLNKEKGTVDIQTNCEFPSQNKECKKLYESIERLFIDEAQLKYPLNIKYWKAVFEPTQENIKKYYSPEGIKVYVQELKNRFIGNITFLKPEIHYGKDKELPYLILHFYQVNYDEKLNIHNSYGFVNKCSIEYKDLKHLTPDRKQNLIQNGINVNWIRNIPLFPAEQIKFDNQDTIMDFKFQELNQSNFKGENGSVN
jgi:hypothetical protein